MAKKKPTKAIVAATIVAMPNPSQTTAGRPSLFPLLAQQVIDKIETYGYSRTKACLSVGISLDTLKNWETEYPDFSEGLARAEVKCEEFHLERIRNGMQGPGYSDWKSSGWFLARKYPDQYSEKQKLEHSGNIEVIKLYQGVDLEKV
ncbi:MAG: hypothetical protein FD167_1964 [bacterium]|nr:MAG: hypothetical protein FD167_1964 [bacterium]